ncbi:hypothetical protein AB1Y20_009020 [Prymnesium parvum]|uniref:Thioredoxin domain-containing protein n=1 Tax=Prymnesium parvum TaxID=97485 RepID=A0AB34K5H1_PRYPA|eukprot:CAMPEP_0113263024 /NCGR_PEP_ID=MMETSP0008_2-20120614/18233_1 /TAXON_ID=97485 /ORGANISM="Prymnesium parvum" /LENGTH=204 /DNA_ID=CAMNT_0000111719 /DNA_START=12 /DNA_END=626 /DNA_ORIENTATION=+ /assembly_acc=CAM_ASM_000153
MALVLCLAAALLQVETDTAPHGSVVDLTSTTFEDAVQEGPWFIKFFAPWCGHCKKISPVWDELAKSEFLRAGVRIARVDCTKEVTIRKKYAIAGYPTLMVFNGSKMYKFTGARSLDTLLAFANGGWETAEEYDPANQPAPPQRTSWVQRIIYLFEPLASSIMRQWKLILFVYAVLAAYVAFKICIPSRSRKASAEQRSTKAHTD